MPSPFRPGITIFSQRVNLLFQQARGEHVDRMSEYVAKAATLLDGANMIMNIIDTRSSPLPYLEIVENGADIAKLYHVAENATLGSMATLRVIFCSFQSNAAEFGRTEGGLQQLDDGSSVPDFCLINMAKKRADNCVLIHEMIHAASGMKPHDADSTSVFSDGLARSVLTPDCAARLKAAAFSWVRT